MLAAIAWRTGPGNYPSVALKPRLTSSNCRCCQRTLATRAPCPPNDPHGAPLYHYILWSVTTLTLKVQGAKQQNKQAREKPLDRNGRTVPKEGQMPQVGGSAPRRPTPKKTSTPVRGDQLGASNNAAVAAQRRTLSSTAHSTVGTSSGSDIVASKRAAVQKAGTGGITKRREVQTSASRVTTERKSANQALSQSRNAKRMGTTAPTGDRQRRKFGGTSGGGGGGGSVGDGFRSGGGGNLGKPISEGGQNDGGRLSGAFRDSNLVGSQNTIDDFDGSSFSGGGFDEVGGAGGGSGSSLAGKEAVGRVGDTEGQSLEEVVYGVNKRGRKVGRARGE